MVRQIAQQMTLTATEITCNSDFFGARPGRSLYDINIPHLENSIGNLLGVADFPGPAEDKGSR